MATDQSGYNTSALYQAKDYDQNALATGLQSAAASDPTQTSTALPASTLRYVQNLNSPNTSYSDTPSDTQNTSANAQTEAAQSQQDASGYGLTAASNNTPYHSYAAFSPVSRLATPASVAQSTQASQAATGASGTVSSSNTALANPVGQAIAALRTGGANSTTANTATFGANTVTYSGPQVLKDGSNYYAFNAGTGQYELAGKVGYYYDNRGNVVGGNGGINSVNGYNLTAQQLASAYNAQSLAADPSNMLNAQQRFNNIVSSSTLAGNLAAYQKERQNALATAQTASAQAAQANAQAATLAYLTTHNGQLSAADQAAMNASIATGGLTTHTQADQANIQAAQAAYAAQAAHAALLSGIAIKPIDTSASDATDRAAMNSLISQYASGTTPGVGNAVAYNAGALGGQNALNHQMAAATSYNTNLQNFGNALSTQYAADTQATGNQLYSDIQGVQQIASQLQQEMGQLSTHASQQAQGQLNSLNSAIQQYQQAVAQYGQDSAIAKNFATSILSSAGSVAALLV